MAKREYNRVAKLKQLQQLKLPKTEIAIRYWHDKQNYELFSTLLLSQHKEYIDAWAEEHCLIQRWQPKLNYPFVAKELVKKAHGLVPARQQPHLQKPPDTIAKQLIIQEDSTATTRAETSTREYSTQASTVLEDSLCYLQRHQAGVRRFPGTPQRQA